MAGILSTPLGWLSPDRDPNEQPDLIAQPPIIESAPALDPQKALWAGTLMDIGNILAGNGSRGQGMQMYMGARNALDRQKRQKVLDQQPKQIIQGADGHYGVFNDGSIRKMDIPATAPKREVIKGADGYNYYQDTGERVLPGVQVAPSNSELPSSVREYEYFKGLPEDQQAVFMEVKRGNQGYLNPLQQAQLEKLQSEQSTTQDTAEGKNNVALNAIGQTRSLIKDISSDKNLSDVTGWIDGRVMGFGQGESDLIAKIDRFKSQIQLELVEKLKGTGPITENEQKILALAGGIDRVQSPKEFKKVLQDLDTFLRVREANITRSQQPANTAASSPAQPAPAGAVNSDPLGILD